MLEFRVVTRWSLLLVGLVGCYAPAAEGPVCLAELPPMVTVALDDGCGWGWTTEHHPFPDCESWGVTEVDGCTRSNAYVCGNGVSIAQSVHYGEEPWFRTVLRDSAAGCYVTELAQPLGE